MCNLYRQKSGPQAIMDAAKAMSSQVGNLAPGDVYPDYVAPIVRMEDDERVLASARWGLPSSPFALEGKKTDKGVTNVRNTSSPHWRRWLMPARRCLVPFDAFSEPGRDAEGKYRPVWFGLTQDRHEPPAFFAGIWVPQWTSVRKLKEGEVTADLFAFLTTEPTEPVKSVHPKAMPVILTEPAEFETWLRADWSEAIALQRPLPAGTLEII
ncbi:SOS response-associated peptidase [Brevundimonas sp.]|jgi:putative SOS response-associated peptidase YedK|uniref:SOS response-associated peptidase n=1 Tax=Brevundimonas sp. TaxID=1871086 RepID=UPI001A23F91C|nr:SOS response-associated peptidase [Brevundimonas sp.]MBJ7509717.1 SOS response-associated peptidase [Brevundimonas sp.]